MNKFYLLLNIGARNDVDKFTTFTILLMMLELSYVKNSAIKDREIAVKNNEAILKIETYSSS